MPKPISQEYLKSILSYDQNTGEFTWLVDRKSNKVKGSIAGSFKEGYKVIHINGENYRAHTLAWLYCYGEIPKEIDHKDRNKANNKIDNLRLADRYLNCQNRNVASNNKHGCSGVSFNEKARRFIAQITVNKKHLHLGSFKILDDAIKARKEAELTYGYGQTNA